LTLKTAILKTERLTLRPQELADAPALFAILSDPEAMRFWSRPVLTRLAVAEELIREQQEAMVSGVCRYWTVIRAGEAIGSVDLSLIESGSAELGFLLRPDCWGTGLATEAAGAVIAHGFDRLGLTRLAAAVQSGNRAAIRVLEKNGFACVQSRAVLLAGGQSKDCGFYLLERGDA
jgi:RimJ/RimL family protein N-acetyltransferase